MPVEKKESACQAERGDLLRIGEVARLCHISVSSLRHYEELGFLQPEYTDPLSRYRYYGPRQLETLNTIRYLRALDTPLTEIADFLRHKDVSRMEALLQSQQQAVEEKIREWQRIGQKISRRLERLREAKREPLDMIRLVRRGPLRMAWLRESLRQPASQDMELPIRQLEREQQEPLVFLGKIGLSLAQESLVRGRYEQYDGIFLLLDEADDYHGAVEVLPAADYAVVCFRGSHHEAPQEYRRLMAFLAAQGWQVTGSAQEVTLIDYGLTNSREEFVTEIAIPVQKE
ncbi:MerR family transcriptional regulator [Mitsuokella sp. AF21-1AC]|uniref:MerR family transcriptional regulator n=1 Tax=Mitsuokella sp. AF21-1AC TaxID=2292235 RepID=UPI000E4E4490|nr:MerR family transcriptional regulator [Mitsuokella sp. AF21-1AC]RGS72997.1 MerR family transcriptional regulator [Mitsuokella sp. AF21-1AC]